MLKKTTPFPQGEMRVSVDPREKNTEVPQLLELEFALEARRPIRKAGTPRFSRARVEAYRAIKAAGEFCDVTVPELALQAGCSVRECQYALRDLEHLGWIQKLQDVARLGGLTGRGAQKRGNVYRVTRPSWAWDGTYPKRLWFLAHQGGVGVHSMHPSLLEALGVENPASLRGPKALSAQQRKRGAQPAPLGRVHSPKSPPLINKGKTQKRGNAASKRLEWPAEAKPFLKAWTDAGYPRAPFPDQAALTAYQEIKLGAGGAAEAAKVAATFLARKDRYLVERGHALAILRKQWTSCLQPAATKAAAKAPVKADSQDALGRIEARHV